MGAGTAKFKSLTALGEGHVAMLLDRGSIPLASTTQNHNRKLKLDYYFFLVCDYPLDVCLDEVLQLRSTQPH